jgi:hypothetical protein
MFFQYTHQALNYRPSNQATYPHHTLSKGKRAHHASMIQTWSEQERHLTRFQLLHPHPHLKMDSPRSNGRRYGPSILPFSDDTQSLFQLKNNTTGKDWFDLPAPAEADLPRLYREVEALRLRNQLDPKRFYRKDPGEGKGIKGLPKHFAVRPDRLHHLIFALIARVMSRSAP